MKIGRIEQQPNEKRKYTISYAEALDPGDLVESVMTTVSPTGLTVSALSNETDVRLTIQDGTNGVTYKITITVTTTGANEILEDEFYVKVKEI